MKTDTADRILGYIITNKQARPYDLVRTLGLSQVAVQKQLKQLVAEGKITKTGKPPLVFYIPAAKPQTQTDKTAILPIDIAGYINTHYLYIMPQGDMLYGVEGFLAWAKAIKEGTQLESTAEEYVATHKTIEKNRSPQGWIDATEKVSITFPDAPVTKLLYADFYSIPKFGKTKLGQYVLYAKQSQNKALIDEVVRQIQPLITNIIAEFAIDTVIFIPPSLPRKLQFMQELSEQLALHLPTIPLAKSYSGSLIVPQKTLSKLEERVQNARDTIFLRSQLPIQAKNILLIDDAVGSGATIVETARKLQSAYTPEITIVGFAIVGSIKGFEVIREV